MKPRRKQSSAAGNPPPKAPNVTKKFVLPEYLAGLESGDLLKKLIQKTGGDPDAIAGNTTAGGISETVSWTFDKAQELKPYRAGGSRKAGKEYEPTTSIRAICAFIGSADFDAFVEFLKDESGDGADRMQDLFESRRRKMNLHNVYIDDAADNGKGRLFYVLRGDAATPENTKSMSMKRLADVLREIRKERAGP